MIETLSHTRTPEEENKNSEEEHFRLWELSITPLGGVALGGLHTESIMTDPDRGLTMTPASNQGATCSYSCPGGGHTCDNCTDAEGCQD